MDRAIRIGGPAQLALCVAIAEGHAAFAFQPCNGLVIGNVIALAMRDADFDHLSGLIGGGIGCVIAFNPQMLHPADKAQIGIAHQDAGQQARFDQNLEAVADAEHQTAARGMGAHRIHDRRTSGNRAAAQIVAIGKSARQHDQIGALRQIMIGMPHRRRSLAGRLRQSLDHILLAVGTGKGNDCGFHGNLLRGERLTYSSHCLFEACRENDQPTFAHNPCLPTWIARNRSSRRL